MYFQRLLRGSRTIKSRGNRDTVDVKQAGVDINPLLHRFLEESFHNSLRNPTGKKQNSISKPQSFQA